MKPIAIITVLLALALSARSSWAQRGTAAASCSSEIQQLISVALQYGLGDVPDNWQQQQRMDFKSPLIPDYGILLKNHAIYISNYVEDANCIVGEVVLPRSSGVTFALIDEEQIRDLAQRDGNGVTYVRANGVRFGEREVRVSLGVALRPTPGDRRGLQCCCGGEMVLQRTSGKWAFKEWQHVLCA
jgi:hypothetical protein